VLRSTGNRRRKGTRFCTRSEYEIPLIKECDEMQEVEVEDKFKMEVRSRGQKGIVSKHGSGWRLA
jgi:hypothetical protein